MATEKKIREEKVSSQHAHITFVGENIKKRAGIIHLKEL
jgi:hypothetical protein